MPDRAARQPRRARAGRRLPGPADEGRARGAGRCLRHPAALQQPHPQTFALVVSTAVDNAKAAATLAAIRSEYARFRAEGVTADELEPLKTKLVTEVREQLRRSPGRRARLRDLLLSGFPADDARDLRGPRPGALAAAVNGSRSRRFPPEPLTFVVVAPSAEGLGADCVIKAPEEISRCE